MFSRNAKPSLHGSNSPPSPSAEATAGAGAPFWVPLAESSAATSSLTTYPPNIKDNAHQPHEKSSKPVFTDTGTVAESSGEQLPQQLIQRRTTVVRDEKKKRRTPGRAVQAQAACYAGKRGHKIKPYMVKRNE